MSRTLPSRSPFMIERLEWRYLLALYGPDVSFGDGGEADVPGGVILDVLANGKILAVGETPGEGTDPIYSASARRLEADGTLDTTFGDGGVLDVGWLFADAYDDDSRMYFSLRADGSLKAYTTDGVLDATFSGDGIIDTSIFLIPVNGNLPDRLRVRGLTPTSTGGLLVRTELQFFGPNTFEDVNSLVRLLPDGSIDMAFGDEGFVILPEDVSLTFLTSQGIIRYTENATHLTRYQDDGVTVDTTFGNQGTLELPFSEQGRLLEQADGKLLLFESDGLIRVHRYNADGSSDTDFGTAGSMGLQPTYDSEDVEQVVLDDQQRLLVVTNRTLYRLTADGDLDAAPFDGSEPLYDMSDPSAFAFDSDGRILVGFFQRSLLIRLDALDPVDVGRDNVLYVHGDQADDVLTIDDSGSMIEVTLNGNLTQIDPNNVVGYGVRLKGGANSATVVTDLPASVRTGEEADTITTGGGNDSIDAGVGDNVIDVGDGNDVVAIGGMPGFDGAGSHNQISGGDGDKVIDPVRGRITVHLGVGNSSIGTAFNGGDDHITIAGGNNSVGLISGTDLLVIGGSGDNHVGISSSSLANVTTGDGNDTFNIFGGGTIVSNGGNDIFDVSRTGDAMTIDMGDGDDQIFVENDTDSAFPAATVHGGGGNDLIEADTGGFADQVFFGDAGNDTLRGGSGNDSLDGGPGEDAIFAVDGDNNTLIGGDGADLIIGAAGADSLLGGDGNDTIGGGHGQNTVFGGAGNDSLSGGDDYDWMWGESGYDTMKGGLGGDFLHGGNGKDRLFGQEGNDRIYGSGNDDALDGGPGRDLLNAGDRNDKIWAADGEADTIDGGAGDDQSDLDELLDLVQNVEMLL